MARQHQTMARVYRAAVEHKIIPGKNLLTELTEVLELDSPQRVKNWDTRGASAEAMLLIQEKTGINATWVATGKGYELIGGNAPAGGSKAVPNIATLLAQLSGVLAALPPNGRRRVADMLNALALAPDSKQLLDSIAAEIASGGLAAANDSADEDGAKTWRKQAMRLAEAHPDGKAKVLLTDFLGKLDSLMRDSGPKTGKSAKTRHEG